MPHKNESQTNYPEAQSIPTSNTHLLTSLQYLLWQKYFMIYIYMYIILLVLWKKQGTKHLFAN